VINFKSTHREAEYTTADLSIPKLNNLPINRK
jgi:hypothetical protein